MRTPNRQSLRVQGVLLLQSSWKPTVVKTMAMKGLMRPATDRGIVGGGRIGDEASMIAHVAAYGVVFRPTPVYPERVNPDTVWTEREWSRWGKHDARLQHAFQKTAGSS